MNQQKDYISGIKKFWKKRFYRISEINRKYSNPRVKMTPMVKIALIALRFYLLFLVAIMFYKFFTLIRK